MPRPRSSQQKRALQTVTHPRRSPRTHSSSNRLHRDSNYYGDAHPLQRSLFSRAPPKQTASRKTTVNSAEKNTLEEVDHNALLVEVVQRNDEFPPPPAPLPVFLNAKDVAVGNTTQQYSSHSQETNTTFSLTFCSIYTFSSLDFCVIDAASSFYLCPINAASSIHFTPSTQSPPFTFTPSPQPLPSTFNVNFENSTQPPSSSCEGEFLAPPLTREGHTQATLQRSTCYVEDVDEDENPVEETVVYIPK